MPATRPARARLDSQYWRANIDPSDRYVQSLPGTDRLRLRADGSGYDNLFLAGDWTDNGLNAGCIEGAVLSGLQAANAVMGRPLDDRTLGVYLPRQVSWNGRSSSSIALPRTSLWITSVGRWPINLIAVSFECGHVESECG